MNKKQKIMIAGVALFAALFLFSGVMLMWQYADGKQSADAFDAVADLFPGILTMGRPLKSCVAVRTERTMPAPNCTEPAAVLVLIWAIAVSSPIHWQRKAEHPCGPPALSLTVRLGAKDGQVSGAGITMWLQRN